MASARDIVVCESKQHFALKESAEAEAHRVNDRYNRTAVVYQCPACGGYCLTAKRAKKRPKAEARAAAKKHQPHGVRNRGDKRRRNDT